MPIKYLVLLLMGAMPVQAYDFKNISSKHILPSYQALSVATDALAQHASSFCSSPSTKNVSQLKEQHKKAFLSWQSVQHLRFGPVQYLSREYRYELWPDKRGTTSKQLARILNSDEVLSQDFDISTKSVAIQGFSALEYILYNTNKIDNKSCQLLSAITVNLSNMSTNILNDWTQSEAPYIHIFNTPGTNNDIYDSEKQLAGELLNALHTELEFIISQKLDRPLGKSLAKAKGKRAEAWRSQSSLSAIQHNIDALSDLFETTFSAQLTQKTREAIQHNFSESKRLLRTISIPLKDAVTNPVERKKLSMLRTQLSSLKRLVAQDITRELNLSLGFNSLDGD